MTAQAAQLELFKQKLPKKPYCTNRLGGISIRPLTQAISYRYLQHNQPSLVSFLVFDVDRVNAAFSWQDAGLPPPMWVAVNPKNGHAHLCYALKTPVCRSNAAKLPPLNYLAAIEAALCERLQADIGYAGLLCKNPFHPHWKTCIYSLEPYDLHDLAEFCPDLNKFKRRKKWREYGIGRNVTLFEEVRSWAYSAVRECWRPGGEKAWQAMVIARCEMINSQFPNPLGIRESDAVAKSISKWVWSNFTPSKFRSIQAHRGAKGGAAKTGSSSAGSGRKQSEGLKNAILELHTQNLSNRAIARELNVSPGTVSNYLQRHYK